MSKKNFFLFLFLSSLLSVLLAVMISDYMRKSEDDNYQSIQERQKSLLAKYHSNPNIKVPEGLNFIYAAELVSPAVVHIKTINSKNVNYHNGLDSFFHKFDNGEGHGRTPHQATGSGVIITDNGYIATNHHVIKNARDIEVVLQDKRSYKARIIGKDPATDLALLKINAKNLSFVRYGNSKTVSVGEWVLAVGNPFDLTSTVTAGIVSAKARNIDLLEDSYAVESFIQTDAAVNPGNSGGALVNLKGELIGINTAIATQTGFYAGYSFAIPINIVKKVMDDLREYGETQRALLGVSIRDIDAQFAKVKGLKALKGVYIEGIMEKGAAKKAGLTRGDVLLSINTTAINSSSELQSAIAIYRPGDKVNITYLRKGRTYSAEVILKNKLGNIAILRSEDLDDITVFGAELQEVSRNEKSELNIRHGVKIINMSEGKFKDAGIKTGFVITHFAEQSVYTPKDIKNALKQPKRTMTIEGIYPNGAKAYYAIGW